MKKLFSMSILFMFLSTLFLYAKDSKTIDVKIFKRIPYKSVYWETKIKTKDKDGVFEDIQKAWYKNKKLRVETFSINKETGEKEKQIIIIKDKQVYAFSPSEKKGTTFSLTNKKNPYINILNSYTGQIKGKKIGSEKVNKVKCDIYSYKTTYNMMGAKIVSNVKEWRNKKNGFVMKTYVKTEPYKVFFQEVPGSITESEVIKIKKNVKIKDSLFNIPDDIEFMDMDALLQQNKKDKDKNSTEKNSDMGEDVMKNVLDSLFGE